MKKSRPRAPDENEKVARPGRQQAKELRIMLSPLKKHFYSLQIENASLKASNDQQEKKLTALEREFNSANLTIKNLRHELYNRDLLERRLKIKIKQETDRMNREFEVKLRQQRQHLQSQMKDKEEKLRLFEEILTDSDENVIQKMDHVNVHEEIKNIEGNLRAKTPSIDTRSRKDRPTPVANLRHRRSQSADRWVDHRPGALVPIGTVLQPLMRRRRSITRLTDPKEITDGASKYCLIAQENDTDGELETKFYKGDIVPTSGGGAQVVFNDIECLKQMSPTGRRKRSGTNHSQDTPDIEITGETKRSRVLH